MTARRKKTDNFIQATGWQAVRLFVLPGVLAILAGCLTVARADTFDAAPPAAAAGGQPTMIYLHRRVTDLTGTLSPDEIMRIAHPLAQIERMTGHQVAVLMLPSVRPQRIDRFAYAVLAANGIGRLHNDDGMLIVVARNDHQVFIATGPGLKRYLTERQASTLVRQVMAPHFRHEDYAGGLEAAAMSLAPRLAQDLPETAHGADEAFAASRPAPVIPPVVPASPVPSAALPVPPAPGPDLLPPVGSANSPAVSAAAHDAALLDQPVVRSVPANAIVAPAIPAKHKARRLPLKEIIAVVVFLVLMVVLRSAMRRRRPPARAGKGEDAEDDIKL